VEELVKNATIVYGRGLGTTPLAKKHGVPYITITEYNLKTNLRMAELNAPSRLRGFKRQIRTHGEFGLEMRDIAQSHSVHCNGYPTYNQSRLVHKNCLLYLDSRMGDADVIAEDKLETRLLQFKAGRRPRLLFSGRYAAIKGALDVIEVGIELFRLGLDFELHTYGRGDLADEMRARVERAAAQSRITVHDAVPFPELIGIAQESDLFVCCHVQDDPSCTYLETFGAGLPIVGYANAMWRELANESMGGIATPLGDVGACTRQIARVLRDPGRFMTMSRKAHAFAKKHTFEREFGRRIDALKEFEPKTSARAAQ
jgi:glycosyltransferase involved in cell wall biosynthesis